MKLKLTLAFCAIATLLLQGQTTVFTKVTDLNPEGKYGRFIATSDGGFMHTSVERDSVLTSAFLYMIKYNSTGNIQWSTRIPSGDYLNTVSKSCAVIQTSDGGYAIAVTHTLWTPARTFASIIRTDNAGNVLWTRWFSGLGLSWANGLCETSDHDLVLCGMTRDTIFNSEEHGFLCRVDSSGNQLWARSYDSPLYIYQEFLTVRESSTGDLLIFGTYTKQGLFLRLDSTGSILVALATSAVNRFVDGLETDSGNVIMMGPNFPTGSTAVYEITPSGVTVWSKKYDYTVDYLGCSMIQAPGGYAIAGEPGLNSCAVVSHIDFAGNTIWTKKYTDVNGETQPCIVHASDNGYCFAGEFSSNTSQDGSIIVVKTDSTGIAECNYVPLGGSVTLPDTLFTDSFVIANVPGEINISYPAAQWLLHAVTHCPVSGMDEPPINNNGIYVYPNPSDGQIIVETEFDTYAQTRIRVSDVSGRIVFEDELRSDHQEIDVSSLSAGLYFLIIEQNGVILSQKPLIRN